MDFIQMGGFTLFKDNQPRGTLTPDLFLKLLETGHIKFPTITEEEIQDRSKGNALSKGLAVVQTSWFVVQCIARHVEGLNITGLEITTAALAIFNATIYFFWWNKPLDVRCSVPVYLLDPRGPPISIKPSKHIGKLQSIDTVFNACSAITTTLPCRTFDCAGYHSGYLIVRTSYCGFNQAFSVTIIGGNVEICPCALQITDTFKITEQARLTDP
jgi:hypothetical protein